VSDPRNAGDDAVASGSHQHASILRFGTFELDLRSGELRKNGSRVSVQDQPLQILSLLLERPGELVTREELRQRLWPADTFVDFEHGLNAAVKRLRDALGDSAEIPRFVETAPRRGYRFVARVDGVAPSATAKRRAMVHPRGWIALAIPAALIAVALAIPRRPRAHLPGRELRPRPGPLGPAAHWPPGPSAHRELGIRRMGRRVLP